MASQEDIVDFLDDFFDVKNIPDISNNGLQVESEPEEVKKIGLLVDATFEAFEKAKQAGCQMVIAHHGISWSDSLKYITGLNFKRVSFLIKNDMSLYAMHHPLDIHDELGHGAQFFKFMGWEQKAKFGTMDGVTYGFETELSEPKSVPEIAREVEEKLSTKCKIYGYGPKEIRRVAFVSGGGGFAIDEAGTKHIDLFITGERSHKTVTAARDLGLNVIFAGHYRTEIAGMISTGKLLKEKFDIEYEFIECNCDL